MLEGTLFECAGGRVELPDASLVFVDRKDGGHLIVNPPRPAWERSVLTPAELTNWSFLVAAAGQAMLDVLPQLEGGCLNYFEAGNWALHDDAEPRGRKRPIEHRKVHMHIFGRSPHASDASWRWGEAPRLPDFKDRRAWAALRERLDTRECAALEARIAQILRTRYAMVL